MDKHSAGRFICIRLFLEERKWRIFLTIFALFLAGVMEGLGVAVLLPIVAGLMDSAGQEVNTNPVTLFISSFFLWMGIPLTLGWMLFVMTVFVVFKGIISIVSMREVGKTAAYVASNFRRRLIAAVLGAKWSSYISLASGRVSSALGQEADRVSRYYLVTCITISDVLLIFVYFVLALFMSWKLSLLAVTVGCILMIALRGFVKVTRRTGRQQTVSLNELLKRLSDSLGSVKAIKAMRRESHYAELLNRDVDLLQKAHREGYSSRETLRLSREPILAVLMAGGLYVSSVVFQADFASVMVLALIFMRMIMKFMSIQSNYQIMAEQESAFQSMDHLITSLEAQGEAFSGSHQPSLEEALVFEDVSFAHENAGGGAVLRGFSARFQARRLNMIVGPSGSGKTTLLDLMIGFYEPDSGRVLLDGTDLADVDMHEWRQMMSYVPQDSGLFNDTIFNNIALGDDRITEEQVWEALRRAGAADFVRAMPQGLQENAGERGGRLSGGQRQRIAIARALVRGPALLLLDEPTSALDHDNEKAFMEVLKELSKSLTVIMITHNNALQRFADHVVELTIHPVMEAVSS